MAKDNASIIYVAGKPFLSLQYPMVCISGSNFLGHQFNNNRIIIYELIVRSLT